MILEIDLDYLVGQPEHNCVTCPHPFLDIDNIHYATGLLLDILWNLLVRLGLLGAFEIAPKMLQKSDFLLQVFGVV